MFDWKNLDAQTRALMREEIDSDVAAGNLFISPRLTPIGARDYPKNLQDAVASGDETTLAAQLRRPGQMQSMEFKGKSFGKVPVNAHETLAEGEFNRFYIRALCRRAIDEGKDEVVVYRARASSNPRPESEMRIGEPVDAHRLLRDLRNRVGLDTALGIPGGPNSGVSVHLP
jgi:hypothetical protein